MINPIIVLNNIFCYTLDPLKTIIQQGLENFRLLFESKHNNIQCYQLSNLNYKFIEHQHIIYNKETDSILIQK